MGILQYIENTGVQRIRKLSIGSYPQFFLLIKIYISRSERIIHDRHYQQGY